MTLRIAFQMDPLEAVSVTADSSYRLAEAAVSRGHQVMHYLPDDLIYREGRVLARGSWFTPDRDAPGNAVRQPEAQFDLATDVDVIWLRQDPPFDMAYITTTHLLDRIREQTLIVNDSFWVRNYPEKLMVLDFADLTPPTMVARSIDDLKAFHADHGTIIVKPLYGNGGAGVFKVGPDGANLNSLHEMFTTMSREPFIVQKFLPAVSSGDKRIILVDGTPVGAINRVPAEGETRSNMHVGGRAEATTLTQREMDICAAIGPRLREKGQVFVGIDVIGDWLTEINVTSPTGIQELERFDGVDIASLIWDAVERRVAEKR